MAESQHPSRATDPVKSRRFLPKFPIWVQDWFASLRVQAMTAEQEGGFLRLCLYQWQEGALPNDDEALLRLARIHGSPVDHRLLLDAFALDADGLRRCPKVARVREEAEAFCDLQATKSALGVAARRRKRTDVPTGQPTGEVRINPRSTPPTPTPTPTPTPISNSDSDSEGTPLTPLAGGVPRRKPAQDAEVVSRREEYRALLASPKAAEAWQSWLEWTGTAGARAKRPQGKQAAAILNRAKTEGADRFAEAVDYAIAGNYLQPTYREPQRTMSSQNGSYLTPGQVAVREVLRRQGGLPL